MFFFCHILVSTIAKFKLCTLCHDSTGKHNTKKKQPQKNNNQPLFDVIIWINNKDNNNGITKNKINTKREGREQFENTSSKKEQKKRDHSVVCNIRTRKIIEVAD